MIFPLKTDDASLLFAITPLILLVTSELLSPYYGKLNIKINRKRLTNAALFFSILFLATVALKVANILTKTT